MGIYQRLCTTATFLFGPFVAQYNNDIVAIDVTKSLGSLRLSRSLYN